MFLNAWNSITYAEQEWESEEGCSLTSLSAFDSSSSPEEHNIASSSSLCEKISPFPQVASLNPLMNVALISFSCKFKNQLAHLFASQDDEEKTTMKNKFNFSEVTLFYATRKSSFAFNILQLCLLR